MALTLSATRKDKPILGFLKDVPSRGAVVTSRRRSRETPEAPPPVFRTSRMNAIKSVSR